MDSGNTSFETDDAGDGRVSMPPEREASFGAAGGATLVPRTMSGLSLARDAGSDNPTPQLVPPPTHAVSGTIGEKHVLVMVGLPARGKTHMAKRLERYLAFFHGARTKVFNVGEYRRKAENNAKAAAAKGEEASAALSRTGISSFFNPLDESAAKERFNFAQGAVRDMVDFLFEGEDISLLSPRGQAAARAAAGSLSNSGSGEPGSPMGRARWSECASQGGASTGASVPMRAVDSGRVAIFDATNSTRTRRSWLRDQLAGLPIKLLFIESLCTDESIVDDNIRRAKISLPEFQHLSPEEAFRDFKARIKHYESVYEPMEEEELSWIKLTNCGKRVETNNIHGYLLGRIVQFLANLHNVPHSIYLTRHGESEYNRVGKIGGDSPLSPQGQAYARVLADYAHTAICHDEGGDHVRARLWTSSLKRTIQTAAHIPHPKLIHPDGSEWVQMSPRVLRNLDEIYAGVCDGMTYAEIEQTYPEEYLLRKEDKLGYRYPRGESYLDVISRLDPLVHELESYSEPVLIVGHQAVLRLIYAYFTGRPRGACPRLSIPLNTIIKLTPRTHDCEEVRMTLDLGPEFPPRSMHKLDGTPLDEDGHAGAEPPSH